jgi:putative transposase
MNPVRAGMVAMPSDYRWPSHAANAGGRYDPHVSRHSVYLALGTTEAERQHAYRELFAEGPAPDELETIRRYLQRQHALGSNASRRQSKASWRAGSVLQRWDGPARSGTRQKLDSDPGFGRGSAALP